MPTSADGATSTIQIMENGIPVNTLDGITAFSTSIDIDTRRRLTLGKQGSSLEQDISGASGSITFSEVTPEVRAMLRRYFLAVSIKQRPNISMVVAVFYPETGEQYADVYSDVRFTGDDRSVARGQDNTITMPWSCGSLSAVNP